MICCHKKCELPDDEIFLPIQVGKMRNDVDLGIQTDCQINGESCENISEKNNVYCEMTAMYWAWKNITELYPDIDYIGLCHYRRYFNVDWTLLDKSKNLIKKLIYSLASLIRKRVYGLESMVTLKSVSCEEMKNNSKKLGPFIKNYDVVSTYPFQMLNCNTDMFFQVIGRKYVELLTEIIDKYFDKYSESYHEQLDSNKLYAQNMIILKKEIFEEYCEFVFGVLDKHIELSMKRKICIDPMKELTYDRLSGYLSEILTSTFVRYARNKYKVGLTGKYFID